MRCRVYTYQRTICVAAAEMTKHEASKKPKSTISIGVLAAGGLFFLTGGLLAWCGIDLINESLAKPSLGSMNQKRAVFANWPSVTGHLDQIDIISHSYTRSREPSGTDFWPEAKYHYEVGAQRYTGDCLRKELSDDKDPYFCNDPLSGLKAAKSKLAAFLPPNAPDLRRRRDADHDVYSYFPNRSVAVYYDPKDPKSSMLDHHWEPENWGDYYGEDVFAAGFMFFISAVVFAVPVLGMIVGRVSKDSIKAHPAVSPMPKPIPLEEQWKIDANIPNQHHTPDESL